MKLLISTDRAWWPAAVVDNGGDCGGAAATAEGAVAPSARRDGGEQSKQGRRLRVGKAKEKKVEQRSTEWATSTVRGGAASAVWPMSACWGREGRTEEGEGQGKGVAE